MLKTTAALLAAATLAPALAAPFTVDEAASTGSLSAEARLLGQTSADAEVSAITGTGSFEVTPPPNATISFSGVELFLEPSVALQFSFVFPFIGTVLIDVEAADAVITYAGEPAGPVEVAADGSFTFPGLLFAASGTVTASSGGAIIQTFDLATLESEPTDVSGAVVFDGDQATVTFTATFEGAQTFEVLGAPGTVDFTATATAVLVGAVAEPCPADFDDDGSADVNDLLGYLGAFRTQDAAADFDGSGAVDVNDLLGFLGAFRRGC